MLPVSKSALVENNAVEVLSLWFSFVLFLFDVKFQVLSGKIIIIIIIIIIIMC